MSEWVRKSERGNTLYLKCQGTHAAHRTAAAKKAIHMENYDLKKYMSMPIDLFPHTIIVCDLVNISWYIFRVFSVRLACR